MDTRKSSLDIKKEIINGINQIGKFTIIDYNYVTTPQHNYLTSIGSNDIKSYIDYYNILNMYKYNIYIYIHI